MALNRGVRSPRRRAASVSLETGARRTRSPSRSPRCRDGARAATRSSSRARTAVDDARRVRRQLGRGQRAGRPPARPWGFPDEPRAERCDQGIRRRGARARGVSRSTTASWSASSARRARASRRCCTSWARSTGRRRAVGSPASTSTALTPPLSALRAPSASCSSSSSCWTAGPRSRTSPTGCSTGVRAPERLRRARAALERVGLADRVRHRPRAVGRRAAARRHRPRDRRPAASCADEPTGNLDTRTGAAVLDAARELNARRRDDRGHHARPESRGAAARVAMRDGRRMRGWRHDRARPRDRLPRRDRAAASAPRPAHAAACGRPCPRSASPSASPRWSPCSGFGVVARGPAAQLDALGTNLLTVGPGQSLFGDEASCPTSAPQMIARIRRVQRVGRSARRRDRAPHDRIDPERDRRDRRVAADLDLLAHGRRSTVRRALPRRGDERYPAVVLGATAAPRLGIDRPRRPRRDRRPLVHVVGILDPVRSPPSSTTRRSIGLPRAHPLVVDGSRRTVYVRVEPSVVAAAAVARRDRQPRAARRGRGLRPSDALAAGAAADRRSPPCSSGSARSRCWSAASGSPTSWSSRCSSGARRSGCDGRSARPGLDRRPVPHRVPAAVAARRGGRRVSARS